MKFIFTILAAFFRSLKSLITSLMSSANETKHVAISIANENIHTTTEVRKQAMKPAFFVFGKLFPKLLMLLMAAFVMNIQSVKAQTALASGDVSIIGFRATNPDQFTFVLLRDITVGTVINFTDNGFTAGTTGRTGEGFLIFTAQTAYTAGTTFTWTNGTTVAADWSTGSGGTANAPTNFSFNASGDQLFAFQGTTANWSTQSGITLVSHQLRQIPQRPLISQLVLHL
jgi:hypothetical protein